MTRDEIMRLEGRELDAAVHERVFGRRVKWATPGVPAFKFPFDPDARMRIPHYSTDIDAAWQVVERLIDAGYPVAISTHPGCWDVRYTVHMRLGLPGNDETLEAADLCELCTVICRAALLAWERAGDNG